MGYQIGFPWSLGVGINFSYTTPNILFDDAQTCPVGNPFDSIITPNLFPGVSISADLGNGPGIQEVATFSVDVAGPAGKVAVSNAHGTVTGAAGGVLLRPFARLISSAGDSVTTYGEPWNMNYAPGNLGLVGLLVSSGQRVGARPFGARAACAACRRRCRFDEYVADLGEQGQLGVLGLLDLRPSFAACCTGGTTRK